MSVESGERHPKTHHGAAVARRAVVGMASLVLCVGFLIAAAGPAPAASNAANGKLIALVPRRIRRNFRCHVVKQQVLGSIAAYDCTFTKHTPASLPPDELEYLLYPSKVALGHAASEITVGLANATPSDNPGQNQCGDFSTFMPACTVDFGPGKGVVSTVDPGQSATGTVVEYNDQDTKKPTIAAAVFDENVLVVVDAGSKAGDILVKWWAHVPAAWVNGLSG